MNEHKWDIFRGNIYTIYFLRVMGRSVGQCWEENGKWHTKMSGTYQQPQFNTLPEAQAEVIKAYEKFEAKMDREKFERDLAFAEHDAKELHMFNTLFTKGT